MSVGREGGGGSGINFQLLIPSLNLLKSKIPYVSGEGGGGLDPTFDPESKSAKIQKSLCQPGGWKGPRTNLQLFILSLNLLKSKIPYVSVGGGGVSATNFQLLKGEGVGHNLFGKIHSSKICVFHAGRG